jgi:hypothetical protein
MKRTILIIIGAVAIGGSCYLLGLAQGTNRGVKGSNSASILFFTGIHQYLKDGQVDRAIKLSEDAIATHSGVIQTSEDHPAASLVFLYPWMGDVLTQNYRKILGGTFVYLNAYPQAVPKETTEFLARYQADYPQTKK